ncbi:MAG: phosphotransferase family protein [Alteromonadaceae bacterium]|nr:phosphotransferase family protein [Alteromonadaceae bacterium]
MTNHQATLVDVLPAHNFDQAALQAYLETQLGSQFSHFSVLQFQGGQSNPTFKISADEHLWVLRKKPAGKLLPSAHMINREYRVMDALKDTAVPVPEMICYCEDAAVIGTEFYVMQYIPGMLVEHPACDGLSVAATKTMYQSMATTLAHLHGVDLASVGLQDYARGGDYYARQIKRWSEQYRKTCEPPAGGEEGAEAMRFLMAYLPDNIPDDSATCLVHGDYRIGNLLFDESRNEVSAVLDWELSTLGHPLADLAYCCIPYHLPANDSGTKGIVGLDLAARGIPSEQAFIDAYCQASGRDGIEQWPFYVGFSMFRLAAILQGVYARAIAGNASSANALNVGARAGVLATTAKALLD